MHPNKLLENLAIICVFSIFLDRAIRGILPFDLYYYYPIFIIFLIALIGITGEIKLPPKWFNIGLSIIFITSFINVLIKQILGWEFFKQVFGIIFTSISYFNAIAVLKFDLPKIFNYYLKFAFFIAGFGVVDNILHNIGIHITTLNQAGPFQFREYSILGEPFFLALSLTPAVVYYLIYFKTNYKSNRARLITIILCYLLTFSSIAITGLAFGVFLSLYLNNYFSIRSNRFALIPIIIIPGIILFNSLIKNVDLINARFNDTANLFFSSKIESEKAGYANSSTFALYSNYIVARDSFLENPILGSGLGSHPIIYMQTFLKYFPEKYLDRFGNQNQQDANSKFLRLMSETGLVGLLLFLWVFIKFFRKKNRANSFENFQLTAINYSIFVYIILCLIRNGNYINIGFFFFFFIYYLSNRFDFSK